MIQKAFNMRDGEMAISFLMQLYIFIIITVLLIIKPTVNALFLSQLGADQLPYAYVIIALVAIFSSYFYNKATAAYSLKKIILVSLLFFSVSFLLLAIFLKSSLVNHFTLYLYYVLVALFGVLVTSQFWVLANLVFDKREAKRLFGFVGAGAIAGGIFGGYLTTILAPIVGNDNVVIVAALLILLCIPIMLKIWQIRIQKLNIYVRKQRKAIDVKFNSSFKLIKSSRHLTYTALIFGVSVIIAKLVDFQFSDFAQTAIPDSDQLASFFGFWFSTFNVIALCIQLFITNKILHYLGVASSLLILPLSIAVGCLLFLTFPELWVLIFLKGVDGSFKQSINKASFELSILPIASTVRNQAKSYIDVVVDSVATGISGFILIFVIKKMDLSSSYVTVIVILFLFLWLVLIYKLREAYFNSFRANLQQIISKSNTHEHQNETKETTVKSAFRILNSGNEFEILTLLNRIDRLKLTPLKESIINLLDHPSEKVVTAAIEQLFKYDRGIASAKVKSLITADSPAVIKAAMHYLIDHTYVSDAKLFDDYLNDANAKVAMAALQSLAEVSRNNPKMGVNYGLEARIELQLDFLKRSENSHLKEEISDLLITIGFSRMETFYPFITTHLQNTNSFIKRNAIKAAGMTSDEKYIDSLIEFLAHKEFRKASIKALKNYGPQISKTILRIDIHESLKHDARKYLPRVVGAFKNQQSISVLLRLAKSKDVDIRTEAVKSLLKLSKKYVNLKIESGTTNRLLLREATYYQNSLYGIILLEKLIANHKSLKVTNQVSIDTITELQIAREEVLQIIKEHLELNVKQLFRLLSFIHTKSDIDVVYGGLSSATDEAKINAIEFLDNMLNVRLKASILPLIEYQFIETNTKIEDDLKLKAFTEKQLLKALINRRGKRMKMACIHLIMQSQNFDYLPLLQSLKKHKNTEIKEFALKAITALEATDALTPKSAE